MSTPSLTPFYFHSFCAQVTSGPRELQQGEVRQAFAQTPAEVAEGERLEHVNAQLAGQETEGESDDDEEEEEGEEDPEGEHEHEHERDGGADGGDNFDDEHGWETASESTTTTTANDPDPPAHPHH